MTTVTEFTLAWVQTASNYDYLIARTVRSDWAAAHLPVISRRGVHHLYTAYSFTEPAGEIIKCPYDCGVENRGWDVGKSIKIVCRRCKGSCSFPKVNLDTWTFLGNRGLIKVKFPQLQRTIDWTFPANAPKVKVRVIPRSVVNPRVTLPRVILPPPTHLDDFLRFHDLAMAATPSVVITPPLSQAPSPSPSDSSLHLEPPLKIVIPACSSLYPSRPSRSASHPRPPDVEMPVPEGRVPVRRRLEDIPPLRLSSETKTSHPRKRPRTKEE